MNGFKSFSDKLRSLVPRGQIGKVVTRFAPEPGGFLHIGHAKAALISRGIASAFDGKMLLRFDDTNPQKEREEFVEAILEDLRRMGVSWDGLSFTSDYFQQLTDMCEEGIRKGFLFCDDTPEEQMRAERRDGLKSKNRELPTEQSLEISEETPEIGKNPCLVVSLDVEMGEIDGYSPLGWSNNLPDTVLEAGVLNIPSNRRTRNKIQTNGNTVHYKKIIVVC